MLLVEQFTRNKFTYLTVITHWFLWDCRRIVIEHHMFSNQFLDVKYPFCQYSSPLPTALAINAKIHIYLNIHACRWILSLSLSVQESFTESFSRFQWCYSTIYIILLSLKFSTLNLSKPTCYRVKWGIKLVSEPAVFLKLYTFQTNSQSHFVKHLCSVDYSLLVKASPSCK